MEWEKLFRKYIWNEQTTPYLTSVPDLTRRQADSEILFYCWFHAILLGMIAILSLRGGPDGRSLGVSYYGLGAPLARVGPGPANADATHLRRRTRSRDRGLGCIR